MKSVFVYVSIYTGSGAGTRVRSGAQGEAASGHDGVVPRAEPR